MAELPGFDPEHHYQEWRKELELLPEPPWQHPTSSLGWSDIPNIRVERAFSYMGSAPQTNDRGWPLSDDIEDRRRIARFRLMHQAVPTFEESDLPLRATEPTPLPQPPMNMLRDSGYYDIPLREHTSVAARLFR